MFIYNGIVYASEKKDELYVRNVKILDDRMMLLTFSNGEERLFDAGILTGSVFSPLSDPDIFNDYVIVDGVVTWMNEEIDCAPEFMYEHSYEYSMV